jgi:hypothetical protein
MDFDPWTNVLAFPPGKIAGILGLLVSIARGSKYTHYHHELML